MIRIAPSKSCTQFSDFISTAILQCCPESCRFGATLARSQHLTWSFSSPLSPRNLAFAMTSITLICGSKTFLSNCSICRTYQGMSCLGITRRPLMRKAVTRTFISTRLPVPFSACSGRVFTLHFVRYHLAGGLVLSHNLGLAVSGAVRSFGVPLSQ